MTYQLTNGAITIKVNSKGAELAEISDNSTGVQYLWNADPAYWERYSPVLFPIVGGLKNKEYTYQGSTYTMSQHGFARDLEFSLVSQTNDTVWLRLEATEQTKRVYPFLFSLEIGYHIEERRVKVLWKVTNQGEETMYFSIGAHPGFMCPIDQKKGQTGYYIGFDKKEELCYRTIDEQGLVTEESYQLDASDGMLQITEHLFDEGVFIIEENQAHQVSLLDENKNPYVTVSFDAPLFGIWSPAKINAPFICIEPWYGRCDSSNYSGSLEEREWGNTLKGQEVFEQAYTIEVFSI